MIKGLSQKLVDAASDMLQAAEDNKKEYQVYFDKMLKKYGVKSPSELSGDKKKEFFAAIEKGWKHDDDHKEKVKESNIPLPGTDEYEEENGDE